MRAREYLPTRITTPSPSSFCAPSPRRGRRPVNLWSVFLSASVCLPVARAHARRVWSSCRETQQVCGGGTAVIPEDSSGLVFVFFCVGEVEASRCVNRCGSLLIVVFFFSLSLFSKSHRFASLKHQLFSGAPRQHLALCYSRVPLLVGTEAESCRWIFVSRGA